MKNKENFRAVTFSTNNTEYKPISIIRQYFMSTKCKNVKYIKNDRVEFEHSIDEKDKNVNSTFIEVIDLEENNNEVFDNADSYIIFIDLENSESYQELDDIFIFINEKCNKEKKIFILGIYTNISLIKENLKEENITEYVDNKKVVYDYLEFNINSSSDLVKIINFIIVQSLENKNGEKDKPTPELDEGQSNSKCNIY